MTNNNLVTIRYPQDAYPALIVGRTAKTLTCRMVSVDGLTPTGSHNGFPVFDHTFTEEQAAARLVGKPFKVYATKTGWRYGSCLPVSLGQARYFRNYSD